MNLAEAIVKVVGDFAGFRRQIASEGDAAGRTLGQRLKGASGTALKAGAAVLGSALAVGFAAGTKGLLELDTAMADFQAETGATADEVERASDKVLEFSQRNLQPIADISATMAALRTQQALTQEGAEALTESYLDFSNVTNQGPVEAVTAFDDILDSWNLKAEDATGLMDKLVASHQKYGGNVADNQATLAQLAPALQAANFEIDDGISLLNLFGAKGLDARTASTAFAKALTQVESPEELQQLIEDIQNTEDPFERAQMAADLFGARAGAKLANALQPGEDFLTDYAITTDEAAGATQEAAEAFESSFGRQAQLWLKNIQGMATGLLQNLGPGIGGIATAASLGGPALGRLFKTMGAGAVGVIPMLVGAIGKIGPALTLMTGPVGIIIAAVAALFIAWQTNFLGIRDIVGNVVGWFVQNVLPTLRAAFDVIVKVVGTAVGIVVEVFKVWLSVWSTIIGAIVTVVRTAIDVVSRVIGGIVTVVGAMVAGVRTGVGAFVAIFRGVAGAIGGIVDVILAPIRGIVGVVGWVAEQVGGFFDWLFGKTDAAKAELASVNSATPTGQFSAGNMGGTRSYQSGAWELMGDQVAQLHRGEMVVPPSAAEALRRWFGGGWPMQAAPAAAGSSDTINVYLLDKMQVRRPSDIMSGLQMLAETGNLGKRRPSNA